MPVLIETLKRIVTGVIDEVRPGLIKAALSGEHADRTNSRHKDNFLSEFDLRLHDRYRELLSDALPSFVYASEEADPQVIGPHADPDLCVLVDPLDTSEMAVRSLYGYTHVMVYSRSLRRPIAAAVGDIFHELQVYIAARDESGVDHAWLIERDGTSHPLRLSRSVPLREALVTNFLMKPDRFGALAEQGRLFEELGSSGRGRIGVDFGSISLCHVAAGFTDSVIEFHKGFAVWDLAPGHYILSAAGGVVVDLRGRAIPLDYGFATVAEIVKAMDDRYKFVAASAMPLAQEVVAALSENRSDRARTHFPQP
ncbi:myo-inositol-1(or 4)-monophosphatase [Nonomuraea endophytica]|uniref:Myo-inositol-1(Or 4)-monophosphatase n=1 Tax=Nonomuraea endophytica TaxID=714136 RepID=A0A7W7ZWE9_9ACTN|nr:inositol monophosphatase family protein [Nonomuraea endophytica]MBB5075017.1 myo-inositol-1(or 4)-monophosphatase [Nonomuraea endophytica]